MPHLARAMLVAAYKLARGTAGVEVSRADVLAEVARSGAMAMTPSELLDYQARVVAEVKGARN